MDEGLFKKHLINIKKRENSKDEILIYIKEKTGVILEKKEIVVSKNKITLNISSVVKQKLFQKNIIILLKEIGYILKQ